MRAESNIKVLMVSKVIQSIEVLKNNNTVECVKNYSGENVNIACL